jgi:hypothetical protein
MMDILKIIAVVLVGLIIVLPRALREERESGKIVSLLKSKENGWTWRSTAAISLKTNIPEDRVRQLCSWHQKITQSEKGKEMWRLAE